MMNRGVLLMVPLVLQGCASYYSHYAMFPAEVSAGENRQIRLSWQTADYPDWWFVDDRATPIKLETQCSDRVWRLRDDRDPDVGACGAGIRACGEPGLDAYAPTGEPVAGHGVRCMAIEPGNGDIVIPQLKNEMDLLVSCLPVVVSLPDGEEEQGIDYLRASPVPYRVYVRTAPRGSLRARLPEFDESVCDDE
ncbi:hypothetical protein [Marinobacter sp. F4216]|uniref:hypothetical protein n=1 Tax=Marinobacter sp. F4216 TaxID=2874281 RepID=UPI001CBCEF43|nr:hypothetical protein [Marinobacter sp. F4216]